MCYSDIRNESACIIEHRIFEIILDFVLPLNFPFHHGLQRIILTKVIRRLNQHVNGQSVFGTISKESLSNFSLYRIGDYQLPRKALGNIIPFLACCFENFLQRLKWIMLLSNHDYCALLLQLTDLNWVPF